MFPQDREGTHRNEKPRFQAAFAHGLSPREATHRVADENIHRPDPMCHRLQRLHGPHKGIRLRRRSVSGLVHGVALKSGSGQRLTIANEVFFRAAVSMGEQRDGVWSGPLGRN